jgi:hypothetical protein
VPPERHYSGGKDVGSIRPDLITTAYKEAAMTKYEYIVPFLFLLGIFPTVNVFADFDPNWTREDTYRQAAATALFTADWYQTRYMALHPCRNAGGGNACDNPFTEVGPLHYFTGKHPSVGQINTYFVISTAGHAAISYMLPPEYRKVWQYVWIGVEAQTVRTNYVGIRHEF